MVIVTVSAVLAFPASSVTTRLKVRVPGCVGGGKGRAGDGVVIQADGQAAGVGGYCPGIGQVTPFTVT